MRNGDEQHMTDYVVSRWYRAPELLLCSNTHGSPIDVWSVGCIFAEILGRKPIFLGRDSLHQLRLIITILGSPYDADLEFIDKERARNYIRSLPYSEGIPFSSYIPMQILWLLTCYRGCLPLIHQKGLLSQKHFNTLTCLIFMTLS
ncbi:Mitogen-activated protein kinase [Ancistrocladus abbreviatus]